MRVPNTCFAEEQDVQALLLGETLVDILREVRTGGGSGRSGGDKKTLVVYLKGQKFQTESCVRSTDVPRRV